MNRFLFDPPNPRVQARRGGDQVQARKGAEGIGTSQCPLATALFPAPSLLRHTLGVSRVV